jgi:hypothetical protein
MSRYYLHTDSYSNGIIASFTVTAAMLETRPFPSSPVLPDCLGQIRHPERQHGPRYSPLKERSHGESTTHTTPEYIDMT